MSGQSRLPLFERELQGLIDRYARDPLIRAILTIDLAIRRSVRRLLDASKSGAGYSTHR